MSETPRPTNDPITDRDIERELTAMTEPPTQTESELWRAALADARSKPDRSTRPIPGRRKNQAHRLVIPAIAMVVVGVTLTAALLPSLSQDRRTARAVAERQPPALTLPAMPELMAESAEVPALAAAIDQSVRSDFDRAVDTQTIAPSPAMGRSAASMGAGARRQPMADSAAPEPMVAARLIATRTEVSLIVQDVEQTVRSCRALLDPTQQEYLQTSNVMGPTGNRRGDITLRVAADRQDAVLDAVRSLGEVDRESMSAEDLTINIADTGARLNSLRQVEQELGDLLDRRENDTLADIVTAQNELGKTRGQIESLEARLRSQQQRVRLSTIVIKARERFDPAPEAVPSYGRTVRSAGRDALIVLDRVLYALVVSTPLWIAATLGGLAWLAWRRVSRR